MIYLSAQPDEPYYIWQLEIQLRNFRSLGIPKDNIHVLVAYNKTIGLNAVFKNFIDNSNNLGKFFIYEDQRLELKYRSSIRPNILKQHFKKYPALKLETLMYHDSDILLSRIPQIDELEENDICYVSDTRSYLDINYIRNISSEHLLDQMLAIVGLSKSKLIQENDQTGGAQYILKGVCDVFWEKVERDSEGLYKLMEDYNTSVWEDCYEKNRQYRSEIRGIQSWCADMWAVLWNLWYFNKKVEIHKEMDFSWPFNPIEDWMDLPILHYSGNVSDKSLYFKKSEYINYVPWYDKSLECIPDTNCSYTIVQFLKQRKFELDALRDKYDNILILLDTEIVDAESVRICEINIAYIQKYFNIKIVIFTSKIDISKSYNIDFIFKSDVDAFSFYEYKKYALYLVMPYNYLLSKDFLSDILCGDNANTVFSFKIKYKVDNLFTEAFSKLLDLDLLNFNYGKFNIEMYYESAFLLDRVNLSKYIRSIKHHLDLKVQYDKVYILN